MIHLDQRRHPTPDEAGGLFKGDTVIRRRLAGLEPKAVLQGVEQGEPALDTAAHACPDPNQAGSGLDKAELRVLGDDAVHLAFGNPEVKADRKSTRLNSSHHSTSYAVFCLK